MTKQKLTETKKQQQSIDLGKGNYVIKPNNPAYITNLTNKKISQK